MIGAVGMAILIFLSCLYWMRVLESDRVNYSDDEEDD